MYDFLWCRRYVDKNIISHRHVTYASDHRLDHVSDRFDFNTNKKLFRVKIKSIRHYANRVVINVHIGDAFAKTVHLKHDITTNILNNVKA